MQHDFHYVGVFLIVTNTQVNWDRRDSSSSLKETNPGNGRFQQGNIISKDGRREI
jgi:hypothetical protein